MERSAEAVKGLEPTPLMNVVLPCGCCLLLLEHSHAFQKHLCLHCVAGGGPEETWRLEGVGAPHDIALAASPMPVKGTGERTLALFVAETKPAGSMLRKFLFIPQGHSHPLAACIMHAGSSFWLEMGLCGLYAKLLDSLLLHKSMMRQMLLDKQVCVYL